MRVCLVNPPSPFLIDPMMMPPLGLWYLWPVLREAGHEVVFADLNEDALPADCGAYLITCTTPHAHLVKGLVGEIPEDRRVVIGGPHPTLLPDEVLSWGSNVVAVCGEGELAINPILDGASRKLRSARISSEKLGRLPIPNRSQAWRYRWNTDTPEGETPTTTIVATRGCPYRCAFCAHALWNGRTTHLPLCRVDLELGDIKQRGFGAVAFYDSSLSLKPQRMLDIGSMCFRYGLWWRCFVRAGVLYDSIIRGMASIGCVEVGIGIESGSQKILNNVDKRTSVEQNTETVQAFKRHGIRVKTYLVLGLPGETEETMEATRRWLLENRPDKMDLACAVPFPGTPMVEEEGYDLRFEFDGDWSEHFWKAHQGETRAHTWTAALSPERILEKREEILNETGIPY